MTTLKYIVDDYANMTDAFPGVAIKVAGQMASFSRAGIHCELEPVATETGGIRKIANRLPFGGDGRNWRPEVAQDCDCYYIRRPYFFSREFVSFLEASKQINPHLKVIVELPTYPYDREYKGKNLPFIWKDRSTRCKLSNVVDAMFTLSQDDEIFGVKTIRGFNGIDLDAVQSRQPNYSECKINIICVAAFADWHAVDRVLIGLSEYRRVSDRQIELHFLGEGEALASLKELSSSLGLDDAVSFYGQCNRKQMDVLYDKCGIAIASLGLHRLGLSLASTLKTREYLAKGIPFVYSGDIDVFQDEPVDFCLQAPADDSPLNFESLVNFYDSLYANESEQEVIKRIRSYAERNVSMDKAMGNVVDYIKENCGE